MMAKEVLVAGPLQMVKALARRLRGRHISPSEQDIAYIHASNKFDSDWYLSRYQDVAAAGLDPITHYVLYGAAEGRDPSGDFSTNFYLQNNPDVKASGINPFRHYLEYGIQEGRRPKPNGHEANASPGKASIYDEDISTIRASGLFDREYYLSRYPDVAKAGMDPVEHYVIHGANEGRSPRPDFDTWFYLRENPDVIIDKLNPFRHYIEKGRGEGRETLPEERKEITGGPLVSVVVPVYAVEQYLADCLRSIVSQSYRNLEVIVVDDGSPDGSYEIADAFARTDSRVRIIRRANGGLGAARNTGVAEARGRYLTFVDSDDIVPRDAIARMVGSLQQSGSDFVVGAVRRLKNGRLMPADGWVKVVHAQDRFRVRLIDFPEILTNVFAWNKLFDTTFFRQEVVRFPEGIRYEDQEPTARAYGRGVFDVLTHTVYHWRIREDGTSITQNKSNPDDLRDRMLVKQRVSRILAKEDASVYESWLAKAVGLDLRPYFEQIPRTDQDFFDQLREGMLSLADKLSPRVWQRVRIIDRLPALAVLAGCRDDTVTAVVRRAEYGYFVPGRLDGGGAYLDRRYLDGMALQVDDELLRLGDADLMVAAAVTSLSWHGSSLRIEGFAYLTNLSFESDFWTEARLVSGDQEPVSLTVRRRDCPRLDLEARDSWNEHAKSGFTIEVDPVALRLDPQSVWRLEVTVGSPRLSESRSAVVRDFDPRSMPATVMASALQDWRRWIAGVDPDTGFTLECVGFSGSVVSAIGYRGGEMEISVPGAGTDKLLLVCDTLRSAIEASVTTSASGDAVFRFALPDLSRHDGREHLWHMHLCGSGRPKKLTWGGDLESLERASQAHHRIRAVMDRRGVLRLSQVGWSAVADDIDVDAGSIAVKGRVDVAGAVTLSARLVGDSQEIAAEVVEFDSVAQQFLVRIPFDPVAISCGETQGRRQGNNLPSLLHGFSLRLSVVYPDRRHERWVRVGTRLQRELPLDMSARRYGLTFTRTPRDSALWVQFRAPYEIDERGRLAQRRLHAVHWPSERGGHGECFELEDAVLFESFAGRQISDSVLAICNEIVRRRLPLALYWSVADTAMPVPDGATPLLIYSKHWMRQLRCSRYLVNNNNFPFFFRKSPGQIYLQTWHGTPLKRIGDDVPRANLSLPYRQLMRREAQYWDYLLAQNDYASEVLPRAFGFSGKVLNVGYPRNDALVGRDAVARRLSVRNQLGFEPYHFVVLYAPTWRDNHFDARGYRRVSHIDPARILEVIGGNGRIVLRGHHNTVRGASGRQRGVVDATNHPDINDLLLAADLLITDYSSVMFDYVVTGKPVLFLVPDIEEYRDQTRGFYFDLEEVAPGPVCRSSDELMDALSRLGCTLEESSARYREFVARFAPRDDGGAAARVVDAVWGPISQPPSPGI